MTKINFYKLVSKENVMQKITPCIWFDNQAEEAVNFYTSLFSNSKIGIISRYDKESAKESGQPEGSILTIEFQLEGYKFLALNGGPTFKLNPSTSMFVYCDGDDVIEQLYNRLKEGGNILMPLDKYDWSPKYAWIEDKFGLTWQLDVENINSSQKIVPSFLFVNEKFDKVKEAFTYYTSIFPDSKIILESAFDKSAGLPDDTVLFAQFKLSDYLFNSMSGSTAKHKFDFNEAFSFIVECEDQQEIDYYWNKLSSEGGSESVCGWLKDKFGVSWQIVPKVLSEFLKDKDPAKSQRVMSAMLQMKKIIIADLEKAYNGN